jgi:chorismate mutase
MVLSIQRKAPLKPKKDGSPILIAGPCGVESKAQVMETAMALGKYPVDILRGGVWKPRTRPDAFEGVGGKGLAWLKRAGEAVGLPVATEVATPNHVEMCLSHEIDVLWIGARTAANPFSVQAIADALQGADVAVMVKNPVSPDIGLWIGAFERLNKAGIKKLAAIHRGFSVGGGGGLRNQPVWRIPIELKRRVPKIPLVCDPSHICGSRKLIKRVAQEAYDLMFDGLMIESHINPDVALSDSAQQLSPDAYGKLIASLEPKRELVDDADFQKELSVLREKIDHIDDKLVHLLGERMRIVEEIGERKKRSKASVFQPSRWEEILENRVEHGKTESLSADFITKVYQLVHEEAVRHQEK